MVTIHSDMSDPIMESPPCCYCKKCGGEIYQYDPVVDEDGRKMHADCFWDYVRELPVDVVADALGMRYEEAII